MEKPGGKRRGKSSPWSQDEVVRLKAAVGLHGRGAWAAVSRVVGTKTATQCANKADAEIRAGRMEEPVRKRKPDPSIRPTRASASNR
jgi:hypothetical protein